MRWNDTLAPSPAPLWFQISERLRSSITTGEFKPGDTLPSETAINAAFSVSRTTTRASLDRLRQEGLISRQSGRGSVVLKPRVEQPANQLASFSDDMRRRGLRASYATFSAETQPTTLEAATVFDLPPGSPAFRISRLLFADDEPIGMSESWLPLAVLKDRLPTPDELDRGSLYAWLSRHHGLRIEGAQEYIEAAIADGDMARRLDVDPGFPLLVARRRSWRQDSTAVEYAVMHYRADRYRFRVDLVGPDGLRPTGPWRHRSGLHELNL